MRLRLLRELGDRGSVAAVAAAMHVSSSAVSQQLGALQARVGVPLTVKNGRTLVLTEAGQALARAASRVELALSEAQDTVDAFLDHRARTVTVSAYHSAGLAFFGPILEALDAEHPISLADADVARHEFPKLTADYDLVIAHRLAHDPEWPTDRVVVVPLLVEPLDIALAADHPLASQKEIRPEQLRDQRWVSTHEGFPLSGVLGIIGALAGGPLNIDHRINEFSVAAQVVRTGAAVAVMPRVTAGSLATDGMVLRPVAGTVLARHVDVLARPEALAHASVRDVLRVIEEVVSGV